MGGEVCESIQRTNISVTVFFAQASIFLGQQGSTVMYHHSIEFAMHPPQRETDHWRTVVLAMVL